MAEETEVKAKAKRSSKRKGKRKGKRSGGSLKSRRNDLRKLEKAARKIGDRATAKAASREIRNLEKYMSIVKSVRI